MYDLIIRNGLLVEGSGAAARQGDLAIKHGRIAAVGQFDGHAAQEIDAAGKVVAPGFVDIHTHYDAQAFWDPTLSPSPFHGVTTIVGGHCGFSIAPLSGKPEDGAYLQRMLARVEGMPLESLREGVPWDWTGFGSYLDKLEGKLAVNAGFMVGHSALRRTIMGERAVGEKADENELAAMQNLLRESIAQGGLGFSTTVSPTHNDMEGRPVPSRHASHGEIVALASVCSEFPGTALECLPGVGAFSDEQKQQMTDLSLAANRPLNWNVLAPSAAMPDMVEAQLSASSYAAERGGKVVALTVPIPMRLRINLTSGFLFDALSPWAEVIALPLPQRKAALSDPAVRRKLEQAPKAPEAGALGMLFNWPTFTLDEVFLEKNKPWQGKTVGEFATAQDKSPFDAMIDLALEEDLRTSFMPLTLGEDDATWTLRGKVWQDERAMIGASDAGAHLDMIDTFAIFSQLLAEGVRKRKLISLEQAIHQLTMRPATLYGIRERGQLKSGYHADIVIFDPETVDCGDTYTRNDLPGGAARLYADARGFSHVIVNGTPIIENNRYTGSVPGTILRSGRDTYSVPVPGGQSREAAAG